MSCGPLSKTYMRGLGKTSQYNQNGEGRDSYIYIHNGGFYPARKTNGVEEIGKSIIHSNQTIFRFFRNCETKTQKLVG